MNSTNAFLLSEITILTITSHTINFVLSLPTNSYVVWLIATKAGGTLVAEFFPLNLAVFEILFCLASTPNILKINFPSATLFAKFSYSFLWSGRPILQCCICIEQFLAVVYPVLFLRYKTIRYKATFSGVAWIVIIGMSLFYTFSSLIKFLVFVSECVVLTAVMLFCYFAVLVALRRAGPGEGKTRKNNNIKRRAFMTILVIIMSFVGTYLLWCVAILSNQNNLFSHERKIFTRICTFITFVTGFVQPVLYLQKTGMISCNKAL